jgi:hypothetical protein
MSYNITINICPDEYSSFFDLLYIVKAETLGLIMVIISRIGVIRDDLSKAWFGLTGSALCMLGTLRMRWTHVCALSACCRGPLTGPSHV